MVKKTCMKYGTLCVVVGTAHVLTVLPRLYQKINDIFIVDEILGGWNLAHMIFHLLLEITIAGILIRGAYTGGRSSAIPWLLTITPYLVLGTGYAIKCSDQKRDEMVPSTAVVVAMWAAWCAVLLFYLANKPKEKKRKKSRFNEHLPSTKGCISKNISSMITL